MGTGVQFRGGDFSKPAGGGWVRLSLTARLLVSNGSVIFQLTKGLGNINFAGGSTRQLMQAPMVERGETASQFCRPADCRRTN